MAPKTGDPDRYLHVRLGVYQYHRRVPKSVLHVDSRAPKIRTTLKTGDLALARIKRDAMETADDEFWASLAMGDVSENPRSRHQAAVLRAEAMGFSYRTVSAMFQHGVDVHDLLARLNALGSSKPGSLAAEAVLGMVDEPRLSVSDAFDVYLTEVKPAELIGKSETQKEDWKKVKQRAVTNFIKQIGDVPISTISRDQARKFYQFWMGRVAPEQGRPTHSASSGNRDVGNMRLLFREYHAHIGDGDRANPFDGLSFSEKVKRTRPPFSTDWIKNEFLGSEKLLGLNAEARAIVLMMIETGARPSELANLGPETIFADAEVPHIAIAPRDDPDDPREIKTASSVRLVPLVGVALEVAKLFPGGFPRYWNNERTLSNTLNKSLRVHGLLQTKKHTAYSIRHSFEDRMKEGQVDEELRRALMGHTIDRPKYGLGGSLALKRDALLRIALAFDPRLVAAGQARRS